MKFQKYLVLWILRKSRERERELIGLAMQRRVGHNATLTTQQNSQEEEDTVLTLELRPRRRIRWDNNVVDNERMNRKKSKSKYAVSLCASSIHTFHTFTNNTNQNAEYFIKRSHSVRVHLKRIVLQMNQLRVMTNGSIGIVAVVLVLAVEVVTIKLVTIKITSVILINKCVMRVASDRII